MDNSTEGFRLSPQQAELWLRQAAAQQNANASCLVAAAGPLDSDRLKAALDQIIARHEILRTTFHRPIGIRTPFQVVAKSAPFLWQEIDLSDRDPAAQQTEIDSAGKHTSLAPFDLENGPLL